VFADTKTLIERACAVLEERRGLVCDRRLEVGIVLTRAQRLALGPNETVEIVFLLGETATAADAQALILSYRTADLDAVYRDVVQHWDDVLGAVQVTARKRRRVVERAISPKELASVAGPARLSTG
jgi:hypothetical protein